MGAVALFQGSMIFSLNRHCIHLEAGVDITAHSAYGFSVALGVPLDGDPVRGDAGASPVGRLNKTGVGRDAAHRVGWDA